MQGQFYEKCISSVNFGHVKAKRSFLDKLLQLIYVLHQRSQIKTKVIHHDIIVILVTTKLSEHVFKNCCHGYKNSAINTKLKIIYP